MREPVDTQPFLTTHDVELLTGVSKRMLAEYVKKGIVAPRRSGDAPTADLLWTYEMVAHVKKVPALLRSRRTLGDVAAIVGQGARATNRLYYEQLVKEDREDRRCLKESVNHNRKIEDTAKLGRIKGLYLRYIPQIWLATIPAGQGKSALPGTREHIELICTLNEVAQVVGWSTTTSFGSITSLDEDMSSGSSYATMALASPAMPTVTGGWVVDGGCYHVIDESVTYPECDGVSCFECTRFGREPTEAELARWRDAESRRPAAAAKTLMIDDMDEPYPSGMWSSYTEQLVGARKRGEGRVHYEHDPDAMRGLSQRPQAMPHEVRLPAGVSSCIVPAGTYLCFQCDEGGQDEAHSMLKGLAMSLKRAPFTAADEQEALGHGAHGRPPGRRKGGPGSILEPFAMPRSPGDPSMTGWHKKDLTQRFIQDLVLPTRMALAPEDGFCIVCNSLPQLDHNAPSRYELGFLVRCKETPPPRMTPRTGADDAPPRRTPITTFPIAGRDGAREAARPLRHARQARVSRRAVTSLVTG